jgi:hypothetical protein
MFRLVECCSLFDGSIRCLLPKINSTDEPVLFAYAPKMRYCRSGPEKIEETACQLTAQDEMIKVSGREILVFRPDALTLGTHP